MTAGHVVNKELSKTTHYLLHTGWITFV